MCDCVSGITPVMPAAVDVALSEELRKIQNSIHSGKTLIFFVCFLASVAGLLGIERKRESCACCLHAGQRKGKRRDTRSCLYTPIPCCCTWDMPPHPTTAVPVVLLLLLLLQVPTGSLMLAARSVTGRQTVEEEMVRVY